MRGESIRSLSDSIVQHYKGDTFVIIALVMSKIFYFFVRDKDQMVVRRHAVDISRRLLSACLRVDAAFIIGLQRVDSETLLNV